MRETQTEVLVVGAGPVGLMTGLLLARAGVRVLVIDREQRVTARSYACALHPAVLEMLDSVKLAQPVIDKSRKVDRVVFYDEKQRRAEIALSVVGGRFTFLVTLPQSELEGILETELRKAGVQVHWNHRLKDFTEQEESVDVKIEELGGTGTGYIVPHWETTVKNERVLRTEFLVGADGHASTVRQRLGLETERSGESQSFAAYEFEPENAAPEELSVVLNGTTNVLWPLPNGRCRWTFELVRSELAEFPEKERRSARLANPSIDERIKAYVEKATARRAPWFHSGVKDIAWCTEVHFEPRVVKSFGRNRCWLAGDAAHQAGPVGVQSMNSGLLEAASLAEKIQKALKQDDGRGDLLSYSADYRQLWRRLIGVQPGLQAREGADPWVKSHLGKILPCLPGLAADLPKLASALKVAW